MDTRALLRQKARAPRKNASGGGRGPIASLSLDTSRLPISCHHESNHNPVTSFAEPPRRHRHDHALHPSSDYIQALSRIFPDSRSGPKRSIAPILNGHSFRRRMSTLCPAEPVVLVSQAWHTGWVSAGVIGVFQRLILPGFLRDQQSLDPMSGRRSDVWNLN
ncbi:hypothetical protein CMUS01_04244 [Colletotrichum musicola]|uniref:Uncharacterized protein n=1 Tax=Colletotrichum musicola TaxID=2175873 RepID=A0A8H6KXL6_9PEZI|nr:hypothetical protein CMUS01_04244 [Colletotrichum musicola]